MIVDVRLVVAGVQRGVLFVVACDDIIVIIAVVILVGGVICAFTGDHAAQQQNLSAQDAGHREPAQQIESATGLGRQVGLALIACVVQALLFAGELHAGHYALG